MGVIRVQKNSNYVVMSKVGLHDDRLSWKAKGLLAYMLSMPNDWKFYDDELVKHAKDGKDALKSAIKELKQHGYMRRERRQNEQGKIEWETIVYEEPYTEKPSMENPSMENPQLLNNKELNNNLLNNKKLVVDKLAEVYQFYQNNFGVLPPIIGEDIEYWCNDLSPELVLEAMKRTLEQNKRNWKYTKGILKDWEHKGVKTLDDVKALETEWKERKKEKPSTPSSPSYKVLSEDDFLF